MIVRIKFGASFVLCVTKAWPPHESVQLADMLVHLPHLAKIKLCCVLPHCTANTVSLSFHPCAFFNALKKFSTDPMLSELLVPLDNAAYNCVGIIAYSLGKFARICVIKCPSDMWCPIVYSLCLVNSSSVIQSVTLTFMFSSLLSLKFLIRSINTSVVIGLYSFFSGFHA